MMVAIVDAEENVNTLLSAIDGMVTGGCLIAISDVTVVKYVEHQDRVEGA